MSDIDKLKDCIAEHEKAVKSLDDKLNTAMQKILENRKAKEAESSHPS